MGASLISSSVSRSGSQPLRAVAGSSALDPGAVERLVEGRHHDPFSVLGPHPVVVDGRPAVAVRAFLPEAQSVDLVVADADSGEQSVPLARLDNGIGLYRYRYIWSDQLYVGVMAQEVALIHPAAVVRDEFTGYMAVNYGLLNGN